MNAIEIRGLTKSFRGMHAVEHLDMTVSVGAIYGFIGENGSGKSTTEKLICGHLVPNGGKITLFGRNYTDPGVRVHVGALIENAGCFPNSSVWDNLMMQAINLGLPNRDDEIRRVLEIVRMEDSARIKFKSCSLGMKQRIGIAMALLGNPALLILGEPINGLDTDGMRIMREILVDITKKYGCTVLISSHILGELEKIATHYGIIRQGKMIKEISAADMDNRSRTFISLKTKDMSGAKNALSKQFPSVKFEEEYLRIYDVNSPEDIAKFLYKNGHTVSEMQKNKIGLEEYYIEIMSKKEA
ncbi:MAG: ATP-binding cassette domain-containing protein [Lachnospiraceae bacterium]|nr:ATP-binding cassette domain-containing protein [Ruminococcus sp.]MCM1275562.1 ATP-binding cassette domain-containing protein [Lachnospiraceae bacterium]